MTDAQKISLLREQAAKLGFELVEKDRIKTLQGSVSIDGDFLKVCRAPEQYVKERHQTAKMGIGRILASEEGVMGESIIPGAHGTDTAVFTLAIILPKKDEDIGS
ncbi:hypothetical protein [uncultured Pelagimonas sp.]|uniref:hypothetical protein n=1 Tax=uncultured Pelagimonas sp. TaxID=1618102 RepID=UPI00262FDD38|nr:hypothetical protein [uncultured Pelagimonas sp.]